jgi:hypothetical protein
MRTKRFVTYTVLAVVVALGGYAIYKLLAADEDAPIIVRNGSMDVLAGKHASKNHRWKWNRRGGGGNPVFIHEPESAYGNDSFGALEVYVVASTKCSSPMVANAVTVTFDDGFSITLTREALPSNNRYRTHVAASSPDLDEVVPAPTPPSPPRPTLRHGVPGVGYISKLQVGGSTCDFTKREDLTMICISPDDAKDGCDLN